ncbi:MerR family transcriptional regulator [Paenibacillus harenae]|uniref:MerR family transcriptional regulator n=1 Tax=Paenibacillus harenae TaxID=306543 RepID=UPI00278D7466|nr:MerR family transcriptional regulator [Paenibacillus harenae]MDQ0060933.1 DNA-binding transcriptional MerR regulator [Paenibacillus harenae]
MEQYTAKQLTEILQGEDAGMNLRTVRYYTQIGVIPPLELVGNKRVYTDNHLHYFRAILTLARSGETLAGIQKQLDRLSIEEVIRIGEKLPLYQADRMLKHDTYVISEDIILSLSSRTAPELRSKIINAVTRLAEGEDQA